MIRFENITAAYSPQQVVVKQVSFTVTGPQIVGLIGPNGAGKSTFIKAALGLIPAKGSVTVDGQPLKSVQRDIAYVEQKSAIDYSFPITVAEVVSLGLYPNLRPWQSLRKEWPKVMAALAAVEMEAFAKRQIGELSGGQFQRVLLARTLVQDAQLIFLDEPFVGIDAASEQIIMALLRQLRGAGRQIFIVHHDLGRVRDYFDSVLILNKELIAFGKTADVFTPNNLKKAYGDAILIGGDLT